MGTSYKRIRGDFERHFLRINHPLPIFFFTRGSLLSVQTLLEHSANAQQRDACGRTALFIAAEQGKTASRRDAGNASVPKELMSFFLEKDASLGASQKG